jgi:2-oxoglutarate dehydrogenase E2 component (dihydrolipoamide succinyltransferase)
MPRQKVSLPELGIDDQPITVSSWLVKRGTCLNEGDQILEILCGGATIDLPATIPGKLVEKLVEVDEILHVGQVLAYIVTPDL